MPKPATPTRQLVSTTVRLDVGLKDEFEAILKREDPENTVSMEIRRFVRSRVEEDRAAQNGDAA